ncbi:MAG: cellulase family glycosylhydrolase, partial [Lachnospiraceae bacterium]|nr:cellulase family glycosylhydrolase [Lachnospiraceae bacterium]
MWRFGQKMNKIAIFLLAMGMLFGGCGRKADPIATESPTVTGAPMLTEAPVVTVSLTPTGTPELTMGSMPTEALTMTVSPALTESPMATESPTVTESPASTEVPSETPLPVPTAEPTESPASMTTPIPTPMPSATPTPSPTPTPVPTVTPRPTPTATPTATPLPVVIVTPTPVTIEGGTGFAVLSDGNNYVDGYYKHWGGEFEETKNAICATEFVAVTGDTYYYYTNDPRVLVTIQQYDKEKKWIIPKKEYRKLERGTKVTLEENTEFLSITLWSSVWGIDLKGLFECDLVIGFVSEEPDFSVHTVAMNLDTWGDPDRWQRGKYSESTGQLLLGDDGLSLGDYCTIEQVKYLVSLPEKSLELRIIELTQDNQVIRQKKLINGEIWTPDNNTEKAAVTLVSTSKDATVQELEEAVKQSGAKLLGYYQDDGYNTVMSPLTATEFVQKMNVGWNLGNSLDCKAKTRGLDANVKQELAWFNPYVEKALIDYVAECGFNTIRIPVTWFYNTGVDEEGNLVIGEEFLARVKQVVNYAIEN